MKTLHFAIIAILFSAIALPLLPAVSAHGVCLGLAPRYARLDSYVLSSESIHTGQNVTITGKLISLTNQTLQVRLLLYSEPGPHGRWVTLSTNPRGNFVLPGNSVISYSISAKALLPGKYYLDPGIDLVGIGASAINNGCPAPPNIQVSGNPLCATSLVAVIKSEDGSPACVKPDTANILIERGWALPSPKDFGYNPGRGPVKLEQQLSENNTKLNQVIDIISISGTGSPPNPGGPEIQLTLMNTGTKPITNLNVTLVLNNNYTFNFKDVTESSPLAPGHSISNTIILIGAGSTNGISYPLIVVGTVNNEPFSYIQNVPIPYTNKNGITK
jgi:hypothetical protein